MISKLLDSALANHDSGVSGSNLYPCNVSNHFNSPITGPSGSYYKFWDYGHKMHGMHRGKRKIKKLKAKMEKRFHAKDAKKGA